MSKKQVQLERHSIWALYSDVEQRKDWRGFQAQVRCSSSSYTGLSTRKAKNEAESHVSELRKLRRAPTGGAHQGHALNTLTTSCYVMNEAEAVEGCQIT